MTPLGPISGARSEAGQIIAAEVTVSLAGARNETLGFAVMLDRAKLDGGTLRVGDLTRDGGNGRLPAGAAEIGQVLPLPVDFNRAGYVRQSGVATGARSVPRAVVPLARQGNGGIAISSLRPEANAWAILWVDLNVPVETPPGDYVGSIEVVDGGGRATARLPIRLSVYDLTLPDSRSLNVSGRITWDALTRHFPDEFEAITPKLINRSEDRYKRPVAVLDRLVTLAQRHRLAISVDRLQPSVKWSPPSVDWTDFDSLVGPWLDGTAFPDREPLGLWPLPGVDFLSNYPASARREYYANAASHFDAREWLSRAPVWIDPPAGGDADGAAARQRLLETAANVLEAHPRLRVAVPLEAEQLKFADDGTTNAALPSRSDVNRILTASPGLIFNTPISPAAPRGGGLAPTFLRTDLAGLIPYAGIGGDERDVRVWAWLAYTRGASILRFDDALPTAAAPDVVADPNELIWFYPGKWFGADGPVPSLQLKWLRRAEQDHEYLSLAGARDERTNAFILARLLTKPVQIQPAQHADAAYALMTGTADPAAWDRGMRILARLILLRPPGQQQADPAQRNAVELELLQWAQPQEKPLLLGRETIFSPAADGDVDVRIGLDVYNPSDTTPRGNSLGFATLPRGWTVDPKPVAIPPLQTYRVQRFGLAARVDPDDVDPRRRARTTVQLTNDFTGRATPLPLQVPVAVSRRREGNLAINGSLEDWSDDDALALSPLVKMVDRPTLQSHEAADAPTPSAIYSAWGESNVYVAFRVSGLAPSAPQTGQNFVRRDFGRAWGEDVCEAIVQPVYDDGTLGPALYVAVKPNGGSEGARKTDLNASGDAAWQSLDVGFRYAYTVDAAGIWRGELAIPWRALGPANAVGGPTKMPAMLRFNFVQHQHATGTTASWAGPIDAGRDDLFTGALVLRGGDAR